MAGGGGQHVGPHRRRKIACPCAVEADDQTVAMDEQRPVALKDGIGGHRAPHDLLHRQRTRRADPGRPRRGLCPLDSRAAYKKHAQRAEAVERGSQHHGQAWYRSLRGRRKAYATKNIG